jgi:ssRNA-specific RNase YbeY (16S rRNA maturation enzyme)
VENWKIVDALEKIKEQQKVDQRTDHEIRQIFLTILSEKKVEGFDNENLKQHLTVVRRSDEGIVEITLKYQRTEPLTGNISFLLDFENYIEAP